MGNIFLEALLKQDTLEDLFVQALPYQGRLLLFFLYGFALLHPGTGDGCGLGFKALLLLSAKRDVSV